MVDLILDVKSAVFKQVLFLGELFDFYHDSCDSEHRLIHDGDVFRLREYDDRIFIYQQCGDKYLILMVYVNVGR